MTEPLKTKRQNDLDPQLPVPAEGQLEAGQLEAEPCLRAEPCLSASKAEPCLQADPPPSAAAGQRQAGP
mgnify:CR=1 FL=1